MTAALRREYGSVLVASTRSWYGSISLSDEECEKAGVDSGKFIAVGKESMAVLKPFATRDVVSFI